LGGGAVVAEEGGDEQEGGSPDEAGCPVRAVLSFLDYPPVNRWGRGGIFCDRLTGLVEYEIGQFAFAFLPQKLVTDLTIVQFAAVVSTIEQHIGEGQLGFFVNRIAS